MRLAVLLALLALHASSARADDPPGSAKAKESLAVCDQADDAPPAEKKKLLERSMALAEEAVAADDRDAKAHFAVFCALGKQAEMAGVSAAILGQVRRCHKEVDCALEIDPEYDAALAGKGAFLIALPRLVFGGDPKEGERLLRHALQNDPDYVRPRLDLARRLDSEGRRDEARTEAQRALASAEKKNDQRGQADAKALLDKLAKR